MTNLELKRMAQELYDGGYDFELGDREQNIRILSADDLTADEAEAVYEYICDLKEHEYEGKTFSVKPYWLHESFSNEFEGCDEDTRFTFADVKTDARNFEMKVAEYIDKYLDVVDDDRYHGCETENGEWDMELAAKLCHEAGMDEEWENADGETFESVIYKAADKLGIKL